MLNYGDIVIYTAVFGSYDQQLPIIHDEGRKIRRVCFTDYDTELQNDSEWEVIRVPQYFYDNKLNSLYFKCLPHVVFGHESRCIWIDSNMENVFITEELIHIAERNAIAGLPHLLRTSILEESEAVVDCNLDYPAKVHSHINKLDTFDGHSSHGLNATGFILRDLRNAQVRLANESWFEMVVNGSRRDQLSFNFACSKHGLTPFPLDVNWQEKNKYFELASTHKNTSNRLLSDKYKLSEIKEKGFSQLSREGYPHGYPALSFFNESWSDNTLTKISFLTEIVRNSDGAMNEDYCYVRKSAPALGEPPDARRSWKREFLRRSLHSSVNIVKIGFNTGLGTLLMLDISPKMKVTVISDELKGHSEDCARFLKFKYKNRFQLIQADVVTIPPNDLTAGFFDLYHLDAMPNPRQFDKAIRLFLNSSAVGCRLLINNAYVDYAKVMIKGMMDNNMIVEIFPNFVSSGENRLFLRV